MNDMIPRIRPYFDWSYIDATNAFDANIPRNKLTDSIAEKLKQNYPNAKQIEFFNKGRSALMVGLDSLNMKEDDEIIVPCFTCSSILEPIISKKIKPVLVDINFDLTMDTNQIKTKINKKTKAILVTHFFGNPSNILDIKKIADESGIYIIEDCAHSFCAEISGIKIGSVGDISITSFGNDKPLSLSKGGALIINNKNILIQLNSSIENLKYNAEINEKNQFLSLLFYYMNTDSSRYNIHIGTNDYYHYFTNNDYSEDVFTHLQKEDLNLTQLIELYKLQKVSTNILWKYGKILINRLRNTSANNLTCNPLLMNTFSLNILNTAMEHISKINNIRDKNRACYIDNLKKNTSIFMPANCHNVPMLRFYIICKTPIMTANVKYKLKNNGYEVGNFNWGTTLNKKIKDRNEYKNAEYISKNIINLPCHPYLDVDEIKNICKIINSTTKI